MKKLIAILVVFAIVAGAAFAQEGSWSISGLGEVGTIWNFNTLSEADMDNDGNPDGTGPLVGLSNYNRRDWYGDFAKMDLNYNRDALSIWVGFNIGDAITTGMYYSDELFGFNAEAKLNDLLTTPGFKVGKFWGWYGFMDNKLYLEAAVKGPDVTWWFTDQAVSNLFDKWSWTNTDGKDAITIEARMIEGLAFGLQLPNIFPFDQFGNVNDGVSVGWSNSHGFPGPWVGWWDGGGADAHSLQKQVFELLAFGGKFSSGALNAVLQGKFNPEFRGAFGAFAGVGYQINDQMNAGLTFQGVFGNKDDHYATFGKDQVYKSWLNNGYDGTIDSEVKDFTAETEANPLLKSYSDIAIGLRFGMNVGQLGFQIDGGIAFLPGTANFYGTGDDTYGQGINNVRISGAYHKGRIGIKPKVSYTIIPTHLVASFEMGFFIDSGYYGEYEVSAWKADDGTENKAQKYVFGSGQLKDGSKTEWVQDKAQAGWDTTLTLWFNPLGTGAISDYWWPSGPLIVGRYKLAGGQFNNGGVHTNDPTHSAFDLVFRWQF